MGYITTLGPTYHSSPVSTQNAWYKHICWRHWQATCMLEPTQGCRTRQIQTHCPTNITQGISAHPAAYFPEINWYWKNIRHLERSNCFPNLQKKAKNLSHPNTGQSHWLVSCVKFLSIVLLLAWLNTLLNWTYFMKCSMASEKRDLARHNL